MLYKPARVGAPLFEQSWPNAKAFRIGLMTGKGMSAASISEVLEDGTTANAVCSMLSEWGHRCDGAKRTYAGVPVQLSGKHRTMIAKEAARRGMDFNELCADVLVTVAKDGLWSAVIDG